MFVIILLKFPYCVSIPCILLYVHADYISNKLLKRVHELC